MRYPPRELYQSIDSFPAAVTIIDARCSIQFANTGMLDFLDLPLDEVVGSKCFQLVHGTRDAIQGCPLMAMVKYKERTEIEVDLAGKQYKVTAEPIFDQDGRLLGGLHIMADVTEPDTWTSDLDHILSQTKKVLSAQ
ncbi:MAG: PAS domain-containing protein [Desulfovermiculus sp.]